MGVARGDRRCARPSTAGYTVTGKKIVGVVGLLAAIVAIVVVIVVLATMEKKPPQFAGVGKYRFGHTTLKDIKDGRCQPETIEGGARKATWCFAVPGFSIADRPAEVQLYFEGTDPDGDLIEIQLKVRGCVEQELDAWMRKAFGPPIDSRATRGYWKNDFLWAAAMMPSEPGQCLVHFLPLSEASEIARIKQK